MLYKLVNKMEKLDREDIIEKEGRVGLRGHDKRLRKGTCLRDIKKYSFPQRSVELWNELGGEVVESKCVHIMKERLDKSRHGDGAERA